MSRVISPVTGKPYGLAAVCRVWRLARSGVYRHQSTPRQRRGPLGAMSDDALTTEIVSLRCRSPFADWGDEGRFCFAAVVMRSVHKFSYGHKFERTAATPVVA